MIGENFGQLLVLEEVESHVKGHRTYKCRCTCGREHFVLRNNLLRNNTTRCTICSRLNRKNKEKRVGIDQNIDLYRIYNSMRYRCKSKGRYKDRNITVCDRWLEKDKGFSNFLEDMGDRPDGATLDRINNDLGYFKDNCRWTSYTYQNHNKSKRKDATTSEYIGVCYDNRSMRWVVQFMKEGNRIVKSFNDELTAAIYYDNLSEKHYNDRPNKTGYEEVVPLRRKSGGITFCRKTNKFRVRITIDGIRKNIGFYDTHEEASTVLEQLKNQT